MRSCPAYAVVQNLLLSPWGALHCFDITSTVKAGAGDSHRNMKINLLINKPALQSPAGCLPTCTPW